MPRGPGLPGRYVYNFFNAFEIFPFLNRAKIQCICCGLELIYFCF